MSTDPAACLPQPADAGRDGSRGEVVVQLRGEAGERQVSAPSGPWPRAPRAGGQLQTVVVLEN